MKLEYDIIVVGGGHAGCEAAHAAACLGAKVLLITIDMTKMAEMSCNPAMGGIAKGQIIREIDALGGYSGIVTDRSMIQFRMLNRSKGPAVWSPRAQCDRGLFVREWRRIIEENENIDLWQDNVNELLIENDQVTGVKTKLNALFYAKAVIITVGTFQNGLMHVGKTKLEGGRISETVSTGITEQLAEFGIESARLKTGTPARLDGRTINFKVLEEQKGDREIRRFSFLNTVLPDQQLSCYITYTNEEVHEILRKGFGDSPLYTGVIKGTGPRYCPSIETKIVTFKDKDKHQLFLEPEGWNTNEYYLNGFSSSLPLDIQYEAIQKIKGLENVKMYRPGYAIEYDFFMPTQLNHNLESKKIGYLFFAGQVNGTTGYEEAAAQGIMAGINAWKKMEGKDAFILKREEAYIGVLIDDLVTKGVDEPYRMFTSRAEYRILLRQDNADSRLTKMAIEIGMASEERKKVYFEKEKTREILNGLIKNTSLPPEQINTFLKNKGTTEIRQKVKLIDVLLRPEVTLSDLFFAISESIDQDVKSAYYFNEIVESIEIESKYKGYIEREKLLAEKIGRLDEIKIDRGIEVDSLLSISTEGRFKLKKYKPETIGQAARISGISPSDINVLLLYMGR
ncbi:MAG: tRNA uridine-5-carboxymethylaminomethyl(34) synthesis enzyme MnmG [Bacteroidales bacterium]|nr:tRNA uridine-5-carboxymethylaminomethyl(34) synthesis enzyme MnmG [Bacteroidales bacterium]